MSKAHHYDTITKFKFDLFSDRKIVENLYIIAKGSMEKTKRRIDNLYKYRSYAPELIQNRENILNNSEDIWSS